MVEVKGNMLGIKGPNKGEKLKQLASCCMKFLKYGSIGDGVENIYTTTCNTT